MTKKSKKQLTQLVETDEQLCMPVVHNPVYVESI